MLLLIISSSSQLIYPYPFVPFSPEAWPELVIVCTWIICLFVCGPAHLNELIVNGCHETTNCGAGSLENTKK